MTHFHTPADTIGSQRRRTSRRRIDPQHMNLRLVPTGTDADLDGGPSQHEPAELSPARLQLVASTEPAVVFASLAAHAVPDLCDSCVIDITETGHPNGAPGPAAPAAGYRIAYPPGNVAEAPPVTPLNVSEASPGSQTMSTGNVLTLRFTHQLDTDDAPGGVGIGDAPRRTCAAIDGVASFTFLDHAPTPMDRLVLVLLIDHAAQILTWQISEHRARAAAQKVENLRIALQTSREIGTAAGILMSLHKLTAAQAFDLLRTASQQCHRKVRDLALDVVSTGWLDPALTPTLGARGH